MIFDYTGGVSRRYFVTVFWLINTGNNDIILTKLFVIRVKEDL